MHQGNAKHHGYCSKYVPSDAILEKIHFFAEAILAFTKTPNFFQNGVTSYTTVTIQKTLSLAFPSCTSGPWLHANTSKLGLRIKLWHLEMTIIICILKMKTLIRVNTSEPRTAAACHRYRRQIYRARGTPAVHHRYRTVPYRMRHLDRVHHRYHAGAVRPVFHHNSFHACSSQQAFTQGLIHFTSFFLYFHPPSLASLYCYTSVLQ